MNTPEPSPHAALRDLERRTFDAFGAISFALQNGLIHRIAMSMTPQGAAVTVIPSIDSKVSDCRNFTGPTPIHAIIATGTHLDHAINVEHQQTARFQEYHNSKGMVQEMRKERIIIPGASTN